MKNKGFTLIELMVVLAVLGITMSLAIPSFRDTIKNNRLSTYTNDFIGTLAVARSEAVKRRATIAVIATTGTPASNEWGGGWRVRIDTPTNNGQILREYESLTVGNTLDNAEDQTIFRFSSRGLLLPGTGPFTFTMCDNRTGETGRQINISITGRHTITNFTCT